MTRLRVTRLALAPMLVALSGCSAFNLVPECAELAETVPITLIPAELVPPGGEIDRARVASLVRVFDAAEVDAGYNVRTCRARIQLSDGSAAVPIMFRAEQSEGAQGWQRITFLNEGADFAELVYALRLAYRGE